MTQKPRKTESRNSDSCTPVFTAARRPDVHYRRTDDKMGYSQAEGYFSALKGQNLTSAITWINPENIMLSGISQAEKDKYYMSPFV